MAVEKQVSVELVTLKTYLLLGGAGKGLYRGGVEYRMPEAVADELLSIRDEDDVPVFCRYVSKKKTAKAEEEAHQPEALDMKGVVTLPRSMRKGASSRASDEIDTAQGRSVEV